jgi:hypothetical protein
MKNGIYLQDEFYSFMSEFKEKNQKDYLNYIKNSDKILGYKLFLIVEDIIKNDDFNKLESLRINGYLLIKKSNKTSKNQYLSGFNKYLDFVGEYISKEDESVSKDSEILTISHSELDIEPEISEVNELDLDNVLKQFSKKEITDNFFFRLITQNRFNKCGLFFPVSFLKQYFYKTGDKAYFDEQIKKQIESIEYITQDSDKNTLNKRKELIIKADKKVYIDGKQLLSFNLETDKNEEMIVQSLSEIAIDHKESMNTILNDLKESNVLSAFVEISNHLKKGLHQPITYKKLTSRGTQLSKDVKFIESINKEQLKSEFEHILSKMELQLMHKKHNNYKRAK